MSYKKSSFYAYFRCVITHCNTIEARKEECNKIYETGLKHGYTCQLLKKIQDKIMKDRVSQERRETDRI